MSNEDDKHDDRASKNMISLSQALLAPLDAIFKAQIHSARSFLNLILQLGYRHQPLDKDGNKIPVENAGKPYYLEFEHEVVTDDNTTKKQKISIPQLAAIPINPLSVESAEFHFAMDVRDTSNRHTQMQDKPEKDEDDELFRNKRPWFLVDKPISVRGNIVAEDSTSAARSQISISVKVGPAKVPAGLNKFITSLGELAEIREMPDKPPKPPTQQATPDTDIKPPQPKQ